MKCRNPSVKKCLNCDKKECDVASGVPMDESELLALFYGGSASLYTLALFRRRQKMRKRGEQCP